MVGEEVTFQVQWNPKVQSFLRTIWNIRFCKGRAVGGKVSWTKLFKDLNTMLRRLASIPWTLWNSINLLSKEEILKIWFWRVILNSRMDQIEVRDVNYIVQCSSLGKRECALLLGQWESKETDFRHLLVEFELWEKEVADYFKIFNENYRILGNIWECERLVRWKDHRKGTRRRKILEFGL